MGDIRHGIIGLGAIAERHIREAEAAGLCIHALCTRDRETLDRCGAALGVPPERRFRDYRDLLRCPGLDSVSICTPNDRHFEMVRAALEAGVPFSVEKPLCLDRAQAEALCALAAARPVPHMICFSYRFLPAARYARHLIRTGALGELRHIFAQYDQGWGNDPARPLTWRFRKEKAGYGALGDLGCHLIDLVRFFAGEFACVTADLGVLMPERVLPDGSGMGRVTVDDYAMFLARLAGGTPAMLEATRFAYGRRNLQRVAVYGARGGLVYEQDLIDGALCSRLEACLTEEDFRANRYRPVTVPEEFACTQMEAFARLLRGDGSGLPATVRDGLAAQLVMDAAARSAETGRWENV